MPPSPRDRSLLSLFRQVAADFAGAAPQLITYEVLFKLLSVSLLTPTATWAVMQLISSTGRVVVGNTDLISFAVSPAGMAAATIAAACFFLLAFLEQAGLLLIGFAAQRGQPLASMSALSGALQRIGPLLRLSLRQLGLYAVVALPFAMVAGAAYVLLLGDRDINYYLAARPPEFLWAVLIGAVCLTCLAACWIFLYVGWIFAVPLLVTGEDSAATAMQKSRWMTRGSRLRILGILAIWAAGVAIVSGVCELLLTLVERSVLSLVGQQPAEAVLLTAALVMLRLLVLGLLSLLSFTSYCLLVARLLAAAVGTPRQRKRRGQEPAAAPRWLSRKPLVFLAAAAAAMGFVAAAAGMLETLEIRPPVAVTAHRGASREAPENTLAAIRRAIELGADYAEIDVQETKDGVLVLHHDADFSRVAGRPVNIWNVDYNEVKQWDIGSWFSPEFSGQRIATLREAIELARGRIKLNIELKFNGHDQQLARRVAELIREEEFEAECVITSLKLQGLEAARGHNERLKIGYVVATSVGRPAALDVDFLSASSGMVDAAFVRRMHAADKNVHVWTVNRPEKMIAMIELGVDNIITDRPELLLDLLAERAELSSVERILLAYRSWRLR